MADKSVTAFSAVALLLLLAISALVWGEFGAFGLGLFKAWAGG